MELRGQELVVVVKNGALDLPTITRNQYSPEARHEEVTGKRPANTQDDTTLKSKLSEEPSILLAIYNLSTSSTEAYPGKHTLHHTLSEEGGEADNQPSCWIHVSFIPYIIVNAVPVAVSDVDFPGRT